MDVKREMKSNRVMKCGHAYKSDKQNMNSKASQKAVGILEDLEEAEGDHLCMAI